MHLLLFCQQTVLLRGDVDIIFGKAISVNSYDNAAADVNIDYSTTITDVIFFVNVIHGKVL